MMRFMTQYWQRPIIHVSPPAPLLILGILFNHGSLFSCYYFPCSKNKEVIIDFSMNKFNKERDRLIGGHFEVSSKIFYNVKRVQESWMNH